MVKRSFFVEYCEHITDFRQEGKVKHLLRDIIFIAVAGTIANADSCIQIEAFAEAFTAWTDEIADKSGKAIVAIDGKTVRGSFDNQNEISAIHIVNAWISSNSLILAQLKISTKSNEITAIPELLDMHLVKGCIITIDANAILQKKLWIKKLIMYLL